MPVALNWQSVRTLPFGNLLALTDNEDLNVRLCDIWAEMLGKPNVWRWGGEESDSGSRFAEGLPRPGLISAEMERGDAKLWSIQTGGTRVYQCFGERWHHGLGPTRCRVTHGIAFDSRGGLLRQAFLPESFGPLQSNGIDGILHELMDRLVAARPDINREEILADLLSREQLNHFCGRWCLHPAHACSRT